MSPRETAVHEFLDTQDQRLVRNLLVELFKLEVENEVEFTPLERWTLTALALKAQNESAG